MPPPGRVTLPPSPPHARLRDSSDRAPPFPAMAPASPDRRYSLCFVALPRPSPRLFHKLCGNLGTPRPLVFNTSCRGDARWGASWWGGLRCPMPQSKYCLMRQKKFLAHPQASDTGGIGPKIGFRLHCRIKYILLPKLPDGIHLN